MRFKYSLILNILLNVCNDCIVREREGKECRTDEVSMLSNNGKAKSPLKTAGARKLRGENDPIGLEST